MIDTDDTICAIASPPGGAVRGVIRLSGPGVLDCLGRGVRLAAAPHPSAARRYPGAVDCGTPLGEVPADLYLWPTRRSYTGQPSAELHLPGSMPVLDAVLQRMVDAGARMARPGEFTLRAFLAGRLDLMQAEAVLGVIEAEDRPSLQTALSQLAGGLSQPLEAIRESLIDLVAEVEAGMDFVEEDIQFIAPEQVARSVAAALAGVRAARDQLHARRSSEETLPLVVLRGLPNAGKSSLINALAGRPVAIVADVRGTTRDSVEAVADLAGTRVRLVDTAGIDPGDDSIAQSAQRQAAERLQRATLELVCVDLSRVESDAWERRRLEEADARGALVVGTKADAPSAARIRLPPGALRTSSLSGEGLDALRAAVARGVDEATGRDRPSAVAATARRCRAELEAAEQALAAAAQLVRDSGDETLVASELRSAMEAIGQVTGRVYTEDVLDRIFSRFCIGK